MSSVEVLSTEVLTGQSAMVPITKTVRTIIYIKYFVLHFSSRSGQPTS